MLLSVLCIVLVIAAVVFAGVYFGLIDKDKGVEENFNQFGDNIKDHFNKLKN